MTMLSPIFGMSNAQLIFLSACFVLTVCLISVALVCKHYLVQLERSLSMILLSGEWNTKNDPIRFPSKGFTSSIIPRLLGQLRRIWEKEAMFQQIIRTISKAESKQSEFSEFALAICSALDEHLLAGNSFSAVLRLSADGIAEFYSRDRRGERVRNVIACLDLPAIRSSESISLDITSSFHNISSLNLDRVLCRKADDTRGEPLCILLCFDTGMNFPTLFSRESREELLGYFCLRLQTAFLLHQQRRGLLLQRDCLLALSHDLRAPAISALDRLNSNSLDCDSGAEHILRSTVREQLAMVDCALVQYSRFDNSATLKNRDSKQGSEQSRDFNWETASVVFAHVLEELKISMKVRSVEIVVSEIPHVEISIPETLLKRVLTNLVLNGAQANAILKIDIRFLVVEDFLCIKVTDNGVGFSEDLSLEGSFPNKLTRSVSGGYGVGLRSVQHIMSQVGGQFRILSSENGAACELLLPCRSQATEYSQEILSEGRLRGRSLLLLEDDLRFSDSLAEFLRAKGMYVEQRAYFSIAQASLENFNPDIVVSDRYLADGDLLANAAEVIFPETPFVLFSTQIPELSERKDVAFLEKPFSKRQLEANITQLLRTNSSGNA